MGRSGSGLVLVALALTFLVLSSSRLPLPAQCVLLESGGRVDYSFPPFFSNVTAAVPILEPPLVCSPDSYWHQVNGSSDICTLVDSRQHVPAVGLSYPPGQGTEGFATRLLVADPVRFYSSHADTSFNTSFVFAMTTASNDTGAGLAFLIVPNKTLGNNLDAGNFKDGAYQVEPETGIRESGDTHVVAVELDIVFDPGYDAHPVPHVGLNINDSFASAASTYLWNMSRFMNREIAVWIEYNAGQQLLRVWMMNVTDESGQPSTSPVRKEDAMLVLSYAGLNLSSQVLQDSYVGFGATAPAAPSIMAIYNWTFTAAMDSPRASLSPAPAPAPAPAPTAGAPGLSISKKASAAAVAGAAVGALVLLIAVVAGMCWWCARRKWFRGNGGGAVASGQSMIISFADHLDGPKEFSYSQLKKATGNFNPDNVIGEGGFGKVYKGVLEVEAGGKKATVAVKRVRPDKLTRKAGSEAQACQGEKEFISELTTIGCLRHRNIVPLRGWCQHLRPGPDACLLLVYEYMPNGTLEQHLLLGRDRDRDRDGDGSGPRPLLLTWEQRHSILRDVAAALVYLHGEGQEGRVVVHRDVKPSNVLLDAALTARLGDFGLARLVLENQHSKTVSDVAGTLGYLAPETVVTGKVSAESDVYSFGVVALEVACGRKAIEWWRPQEDQRILITWVLGLAKAGRLAEAADPALAPTLQQGGMILGVLRLGLLCCIGQPEDRPSMRLVSRYLTAPAALAMPNWKLPDLSKAYFQQLHYPTGLHSLQDVQDIPHS